MNMKKIVIFGGGSGLSQILKGLKLFPLDITAVVSVSDDGKSTGRLRKEMNIPAVGDITKVMLAMANVSDDMASLMNYRFTKSKTISNHSVKNLLLTALLDLKGSFEEALPVMEDILDLEKAKVLPLTEDSVDLVGITENGKHIVGEHNITESKSKIKRIAYDKEIEVNPSVIKAVNEADLIIFSSGSLYTSIIPHLLNEKFNKIIRNSKSKKMYLCNLFTQPGETDNFNVSDHINTLESYLGLHTINIVVANSKPMSSTLSKKYASEEQKDPVVLDSDELLNNNIEIISDKLYKIEDGYYRHDSLKTAYLIFSYLMENEK